MGARRRIDTTGSGRRGGTFPFSKDYRIKRKRDFERIFREGERRRGKWALFCFCPNGKGNSRLGLSVGKEYGNAVARNRAKRIIREAFRLNRGTLPGNLDIVVIPALGAPPLEVETFGREMRKILSPYSFNGKKGS